MSNYQYPDDEFDAADADGPVPVGVHRAQVPAWRSWIPLLAVLIIVPLVAWGAVALLRHGGAPSSTATSSESGAAPDALHDLLAYAGVVGVDEDREAVGVLVGHGVLRQGHGQVLRTV